MFYVGVFASSSTTTSPQMVDQLILSRQNIITRKDIYNIATQMGLRRDQLDRNDGVSVDLFVQQYAEKEFTPFFCYHPQDDSAGPDGGQFTLGKLCYIGFKILYRLL